MNKKAKEWIKHISTSPLMPAGFDPATIMTILGIVLPLIIKWCQAHKKPEQLRAKAATALAAGGAQTKPSPKLRKRLAKHGMPNEADQDQFYLAILADGASSKESDFTAALADINWDEVK